MAAGAVVGLIIGACCYCCITGAVGYYLMLKMKRAGGKTTNEVNVIVNN